MSENNVKHKMPTVSDLVTALEDKCEDGLANALSEAQKEYIKQCRTFREPSISAKQTMPPDISDELKTFMQITGREINIRALRAEIEGELNRINSAQEKLRGDGLYSVKELATILRISEQEASEKDLVWATAAVNAHVNSLKYCLDKLDSLDKSGVKDIPN